MFTDVVDLRSFYTSRRGQMARRLIGKRIRRVWPDLKGQSLLGLGYATPFLGSFRSEAERVVAVMPASQGVMAWPADAANQVALADEAELPLPDLSFDRVLLVHAIEGAEQLRVMLREIWRVLAGNGRLLVVVPNRRGLWARSDRSPFGHGQPYSQGQLSKLLRDTLFTPVQGAGALYLPPWGIRLMSRSASAVDEIGERWFRTFAGVVLVEAQKQVYAASAVRAPKRRRLLVPLPGRAVSAAQRLERTPQE
jgi:SAM-dependent methyltransferase